MIRYNKAAQQQKKPSFKCNFNLLRKLTCQQSARVFLKKVSLTRYAFICV